jgi:hypothetical protein
METHMPRHWMDDPRRDRWEEPRERVRSRDRDDFGQADYSGDYAYDRESHTAHRVADEARSRGDDYGQADYSSDYAYDAEHGRGYRRFSEDDRDYGDARAADRGYGRRMDEGDYRRDEPARSWRGRAAAFFSGSEDRPRRRRGPSDRVLWAVIVERLEDERGLDLRDVEVLVDNAEVTLNGTVRRKTDRRRIEDLVDIDGVRHVQNNLRTRESRWF